MKFLYDSQFILFAFAQSLSSEKRRWVRDMPKLRFISATMQSSSSLGVLNSIRLIPHESAIFLLQLGSLFGLS